MADIINYHQFSRRFGPRFDPLTFQYVRPEWFVVPIQFEGMLPDGTVEVKVCDSVCVKYKVPFTKYYTIHRFNYKPFWDSLGLLVPYKTNLFVEFPLSLRSHTNYIGFLCANDALMPA